MKHKIYHCKVKLLFSILRNWFVCLHLFPFTPHSLPPHQNQTKNLIADSSRKTFSVEVVSFQKRTWPLAFSSLLLLSGGLELGQGFQFSHRDFPTWPIIKKKLKHLLVYFFHIYYLMWSLSSVKAQSLCIFAVSHFAFFLEIGHNHKKEWNSTIYPLFSLQNEKKR